MSVRTGNPPDVIRILDTPVSHYDIIQEGPFATVARAWTTIKGGVTEWVVVKSATTQRKFAREPHDIVKELRVLSTTTHPNIVSLLGSFRDDDQSLLSIYIPYLPMSLASLLASPRFSPCPFPPPHRLSSPASRNHPSTVPSKTSPELQTVKFMLMARSILAQTLEALAFLHNPVRSVGHRDIKPENIMLTDNGCVKLIDFGVAWKGKENDLAKSNDLWPEYKGKLYFQVSTRAYRAPELLFGSRHYDHLAIDIWSLGVTFAEFFTSLRLHGGDDYDDGDEDEDDDDETTGDRDDTSPFVIPRYLRIGYPGSHWRRDSLFDGQRGEIGLAWSIFKILGTPNSSNWPDFKSLPGASSVVFKVVPGAPLRPLLSNLPPSVLVDPTILDKVFNQSEVKALLEETCEQQSSSVPVSPLSNLTLDAKSTGSETTTDWTNVISASEGEQEIPTVLDLLRRFLLYPSAARLRAEDALKHSWFVERLDGKSTGTGTSVSPGPSDISCLSPSPTSGDGKSKVIITPRPRDSDAGPTSNNQPSPDCICLGSNDEAEAVDVAPPLLLLPPGYALESSPSSLKAISVNTWCGFTLGDLLLDVMGDPRGDV